MRRAKALCLFRLSKAAHLLARRAARAARSVYGRAPFEFDFGCDCYFEDEDCDLLSAGPGLSHEEWARAHPLTAEAHRQQKAAEAYPGRDVAMLGDRA